MDCRALDVCQRVQAQGVELSIENDETLTRHLARSILGGFIFGGARWC